MHSLLIIFAIPLLLLSSLVSPSPLERFHSPAQVPIMASLEQGKPTIYFGYGSNLWLHQMDLRCPTSEYLGIARLNGYKWIINDRGYANVVQVSNHSTTEDTDEANKGSKEYEHVVFGLVYSLKEEDEKRLDKNEGVPVAYTKEDLPCDFWPSHGGKWVDVSKKPSKKEDMLVYIDR